MEPKISIATVVRNGDRTLRATIESVVLQLASEIEYVIVDGASTDRTLSIVREYDGIVRWISEPDCGIYDAMNKALKLARGDWLIFLGADDLLLPGFRDLTSLLREPDTVYYGDVEVAGSAAVWGGRFSRYRLMQENICHQALFYPRSVYRHKDYDTGVGALADHKYNIELWGAGVRFVHVPRIVSRFDATGASSGDHRYFEPVRLAAIRRSFGPAYYLLKCMRNAAVRAVKGSRGSA